MRWFGRKDGRLMNAHQRKVRERTLIRLLRKWGLDSKQKTMFVLDLLSMVPQKVVNGGDNREFQEALTQAYKEKCVKADLSIHDQPR